jgi:hypothetical protein
MWPLRLAVGNESHANGKRQQEAVEQYQRVYGMFCSRLHAAT